MIFELDLWIINLINSFQRLSLTKIMLFFTMLGGTKMILLGLILSSFLLFLNKKNCFYLLLISVIGGEGIVFIIKEIIQRPRPYLHSMISSSGFSFPSGHSFAAVSFYGLLAYLLFKLSKSKLGKFFLILICSILIIFIGISRIYLGVHWPSDVLGGYLLGASWIGILIAFLEIKK